MSPAADLLNVAVTAREVDGRERYAFAIVPTAAEGVELHDDWDALGMRASGSGSVSFHDVAIGGDAVRDGFELDTISAAMLSRYLVSGAFHAAASLGVAEAAHLQALRSMRGRPLEGPTQAHQTMRLAENVVDMAAMQALFGRVAASIDLHQQHHPGGSAPYDAVAAVTAEVQAAKAFLGDAAVRVVDRAMALSGGAGYLNTHPLAKAYRDARAAAFMHPMGSNRAMDFIARTAIGLAPLPG
jgi:alkylation response protein AidB-like acyl-CoA dehydrogenase